MGEQRYRLPEELGGGEVSVLHGMAQPGNKVGSSPNRSSQPVTLPWHHHTDDNDDIRVGLEPAPNGGRYVHVSMAVDDDGPLHDVAAGRVAAWAYFGADEAVEFAHAVLAAAAQVESGSV